jgi:endogenous inhibitor of DNA gyrase (YacG/DUF329 family)
MRRNGAYRGCKRCGNPFYVCPGDDAKSVRRGYALRTFCSAACQHVSYMGSGNPNWRGGSSVRTKPLSFSAWIAGREAMAMEA